MKTIRNMIAFAVLALVSTTAFAAFDGQTYTNDSGVTLVVTVQYDVTYAHYWDNDFQNAGAVIQRTIEPSESVDFFAEGYADTGIYPGWYYYFWPSASVISEVPL
jgi:hypothetical protein